jgi:hypothetical protein
MHQPSDIIGWGADAPRGNRPGVPREYDPPQPIGNMSLSVPEQQRGRQPSARSPWRPLTPVYGTAIPPRGLSGAIRKMAYRTPDYKARRWMLLMVADRIDVLEHNLVPTAMLASAIAIGLLGLRALARR